MKFSNTNDYRNWSNKAVTLLGMSGVGKTRLANNLPRSHWFHYSVDYRIGTRYMEEPILDNIKAHAMSDPFLRCLLLTDSIHIGSNISFNNLDPLSTFLGKIGRSDQGGLGKQEFVRRQRLHHEAEVAAMLDMPAFIRKGREIYDYPHFLCDASGSLCEVVDLDDPNDPTLRAVTDNSLLLYIKASQEDEIALRARAQAQPKPLYYREEFLEQALGEFLMERNLSAPDDIEPDDFVTWVFPKLVEQRRPRYNIIGETHGYVIESSEVALVRDEQDFEDLVCLAISRAN